jgi:exodeoxyribonuclease VII small subunit
MKNNKSLEVDLKRLKEISDLIENDKIDFNESLNLFKEGMELTKKCKSLLDESELKIQKIIDNNNSINLTDYSLDS